MSPALEQIVTYALVFLLCLVIIVWYFRVQKRRSRLTEAKIALAREEGLYEPVSLHPVVNPDNCIRTGACISACPEKDILGIVNGKATTINASRCVGHGACFHACPTQAITLCIGTEQRGVDLPHVSQSFETNVPGIFIAGELGGMGLIRNAVEQGRQAVDSIVRLRKGSHSADYDLIIVGAGPAGISASLNARKHGLSTLTLDQDTLGGTVFSFPRSKVVMTSPMDLPLHGRVKLFETSKPELLKLWNEVLSRHEIAIRENTRVEAIQKENGHFVIRCEGGDSFTARSVLLAIGRRGSPRKLGVPGEELEKVAYRLMEPEEITGKRIVVVGGGDSAVESALMLAPRNETVLMYRGEAFSRLKPRNSASVRQAMEEGQLQVLFRTNLKTIGRDEVSYQTEGEAGPIVLPNDLVYIFAGGELPTRFLEKAGILITRRFGEAIMKHES
ncbi:MAG TPA: NAD(P)-binding domain-containing protein [Bacteroidales bacterium]|nr:NAD(P)-binding domain-containing protein [Bacteroidales bacterium]